MVGDGIMLLLEGLTAKPIGRAKIRRLLRYTPRLVGMHPITTPEVVPTPVGFSGFVIMAESHISVEVQDCHVWVDIFSCAPFDTIRAEKCVVRFLGLIEHHATVIPRPMPPSTLTLSCQADRRELMEAMEAFTASLPV